MAIIIHSRPRNESWRLKRLYTIPSSRIEKLTLALNPVFALATQNKRPTYEAVYSVICTPLIMWGLDPQALHDLQKSLSLPTCCPSLACLASLISCTLAKVLSSIEISYVNCTSVLSKCLVWASYCWICKTLLNLDCWGVALWAADKLRASRCFTIMCILKLAWWSSLDFSGKLTTSLPTRLRIRFCMCCCDLMVESSAPYSSFVNWEDTQAWCYCHPKSPCLKLNVLLWFEDKIQFEEWESICPLLTSSCCNCSYYSCELLMDIHSLFATALPTGQRSLFESDSTVELSEKCSVVQGCELHLSMRRQG